LREAAELKGWIIDIIMDQLVPFAIAGLFARLQASQTIEDTQRGFAESTAGPPRVSCVQVPASVRSFQDPTRTGVLALITSGELHNLAVACSWSPLEMPFSRSVTDCTSSANEA